MKATFARLFLFLITVAALPDVASGQARRFGFQPLTEQDGLPQNFVYGLMQDRQGFLWISTGAGLARYDGFEMTTYTSRDSLGADFISSSYHSASGKLVFGLNNGGVSLFDGTRFKKLLPDTVGTRVVGIAENKADHFWIATQSSGLFFIDYTNRTVTGVFPSQLEGQIINTIHCRDGILWIGTNEGLWLYEASGDVLKPLDLGIIPPQVSIHSILAHHSDTTLTWVGTAFHGIKLVARGARRGTFTVLRTFAQEELSGDIVQAMAQDASGDLWVGTRLHGVLQFNLARNGLSVFATNYYSRDTGFPFISVNTLTIDGQGQVWVGSVGDGVIRIYKELFTYFSFKELGVSEVRSITEMSTGYLAATDVGLIRISLNTQSDEYEVEPMELFKGESILSLFTDSRGIVWIGTEMKGVHIYSDSAHHVQRIRINQTGFPVEARLFDEDIHGNIWISARAQGVFVVDKNFAVVKRLTTANRFIHNDVFAIKADSRGNIWFGTYGAGLAMLDPKDRLQLFSQSDTLKARDINDIDEDAEGNIWIATEGNGFFKYTEGKFVQIGSAQNLVSPFIKGMQYDPTGRVWFSHRKGLGYYDVKTEKKYHFDVQDGLLPTEAYSSSIIVDSKANKWFCNDFGVTLFEHDTATSIRKALETYLTGIRIFFKQYPADLRTTQPDITAEPRLELAYDNNHVTFDFVAVKLNGSGKIFYRHFLEGYDAEWTPPEEANFVTYTNLDPGKYVMKVQATDDLGAWVDPVTAYPFEITPPFWRRTWFYLLQIASVIGLFTLTYLVGKRGMARKRFVLRLMLFSSFFITLEYVENFIDPLVSGSFGGVPIFRFFLNFLLALLLLPVETLITHWLMDRQAKAVVGMPEALEEEVLLDDDNYGAPRE